MPSVTTGAQPSTGSSVSTGVVTEVTTGLLATSATPGYTIASKSSNSSTCMLFERRSDILSNCHHRCFSWWVSTFVFIGNWFSRLSETKVKTYLHLFMFL